MACKEHCSVDIVMEGGGIKGIALVGALAALEDRGYRWVNTAGTSAGAIVATLAAAGYTAQELRKIIGEVDFNGFLDSWPRWLDAVPGWCLPLSRVTRMSYNFLVHWGFYRGDVFLDWMRGLLAAKGVHTFADLKRGIPDRNQLYRVRVVASDVTRSKMIVLPEDIADYGIEPDDLEVALAVRMSMSIPGYFRPVTLHVADPATGARVPCYIVDGGLLSNFPIKLFDGPGMDERPTFGIRMTGHGRPPVTRYRATGILSYVMAMFGTAMSAADSYYLDTHTFLRTIEVDNLGISPIRFDLSRAEKVALYESGAAGAREFLSDWDFDKWRKAYAHWASGGRRGIITQALENAP